MHKLRLHRAASLMLATVISAATLLSGCGGGSTEESSDADNVIGSGDDTIRILSGSENKELVPILEDYCKENHVQIEMTYMGSLDIMRELEKEDFDYDAVWPASSVWMNAGDEKLHRIKHAESISITPVVFGIKKSKAESLGFVGRNVTVADIIAKIQSGDLKFCMTSATQSNSGASAYISFLYALLGNPDMITTTDLDNEEMKTQMKTFLSGVNRSSGSSDWLKEMFLNGGYDAMVNYECLMVSADRQLEEEGKEPLYVVYPSDGLAIADSPLGYVDQGDEKAEEHFKGLQKYLLSAETQSKIQKTGRRSSYTGIDKANRDVFRKEWGLDPDRVLTTKKMPDLKTFEACLNLYQIELRKPSLSVYCMDYSGSMRGEGNEQLVKSMEQLLIQKNASANYLQASPDDVNILIPFNHDVLNIYKATGNGTELEALYEDVKNQTPTGGTNMYAALDEALRQLSTYDTSQYTTAIIVLTDGMSKNYYDEFHEEYRAENRDIPIFSIMYGDADSEQLDELAKLTNARVFDGRDDLVDAFRKVKGYN